jgi:multiple sugar transport system ATP-binding protein
MPMAQISLQRVSKRYPDGALAVEGFSLDVGDGELVVLVGPSGCGKSTVLNMVAGLEEVTEGTIAIDGRVVNDASPKDRDIAMVFQSYALYPHMTVRENIAFPLKIAGLDDATVGRRVEETAQMLELRAHLDRRPAHLSGGQRQRVAMGRAIVRRPKAFLMDEPLSNLDVRLRVEMRRQVARIQRTLGTTTLYVTHDQTEAMTLGDRIVVMRRGLIQQVGTPQELYDRPANLFVAGFMGSPSMSFLPGTLEGGRLRTPLGEVELPGEVSASAGREVIAGIRPEHFEEAAVAGERPGGRARVSIDVVEPVGSDVFAYFTVPGEPPPAVGLSGLMADGEGGQDGIQVAARLGAGSRVREGESVELWYDAARVHLFDEESGERLEA